MVMINKKFNLGQMKIQQMAFMLIAVMVFFALIGLLIITVKSSGLKEQATELHKKNARLLVAKIANSPEFSCGNALGSGVSCIDLDKVMILTNMPEYEGFWGDVSKIEIRKIYPFGEEICDLSNYPKCDIIQVVKGKGGSSVGNFVSICRKEFDGTKTYDKCELGRMLVSYEEVQ